MDLEELPADKLVLMYRKIRGAKDAAEEEYKEKVAELREQMDAIEARLLVICNEQNANSLNLPSGTVSRRKSTNYWTSDWDSMYEFIREHNAEYLLEKRIHNKNMQEFLDENPDEMPVGLNSDTRYKIVVSKPRNK